MSDPRICIIGAGNLATRRICPYIGAASAELAGVCDLDSERAERTARRFGGTPYEDANEMLDEIKPDGVIICIGAQQHYELAPAIMRRGIPVYTEKPPAPTAAMAYEVAQVSRDTGVLCTTAFKKRYNVAYSRAKEWIASFPQSSLYSLSIDFASGQYSNEDEAHSFLLEFAIHAIDLAGYLFGDVQNVFAFAKDRDAYAVSLLFENGAVGTLNLNGGRSFSVPTEEVEISVRGGNFMTIHNSASWRITRNEKPCEWHEPLTFTSAGDSGNDTGHLAELVDFVGALRAGRTTRSNIYESYKSMVLYETINESVRTGAPIRPLYLEL